MAARREKAGLFINEYGNLGNPRGLFEDGFRWCIVKGHSGPYPPDVGHIGEAALVGLRNIFGHENVGCWGNFESHSDPIQSAWAANGVIAARGFPFYVANIESNFPDRVFLKELRRLQPRLVIWLSCEIENPRDWPAWFKIGEVKPRSRIAQGWLPQCYMNLNPGGTPEQAVYWAQRRDISEALIHWCPAEYVKPTVSVIGGGVDPARDVETLFNANARAMGLGPGFSVYLAENIQLSHKVEFRKAIARGAALL